MFFFSDDMHVNKQVHAYMLTIKAPASVYYFVSEVEHKHKKWVH